MKLLPILLLAACMSGNGQRVTYGFVQIGDEISGHERIIKDTICGDCVFDYKKGNIPTKYHWVEYRIFEPPGYFEIMKWYWTKFPKTYNGWAIEVQEIFYIHGYTEGTKLDKLNITCDTCGYFKKYTDDLVLSYGYDDEASLRITQNKDTLNKYSKLQYP
jgi:hypothetical protein